MIKLYGPYPRKDGRKHVVLYDTLTQERRTVSYPKYLMEQKLGRELLPHEEVHHKDENTSNDDIDNLEILHEIDHNKKHRDVAYNVKLTCLLCGVEFYSRGSQYNHNRRLGKAGPFCSKQCSGKYGAELQNGRTNKLPVSSEVKIEYYKEG